MRLCDIAHQDMVISRRDHRGHPARQGQRPDRVHPSLEAATPIENELDRLDILYGLGIRSSGIAYSEANTLGCGLREARDGGLTEFGRQAVRRMNKLGIAIDISHSGDQTSLDTIDGRATSRSSSPTRGRAPVGHEAHEAGHVLRRRAPRRAA